MVIFKSAGLFILSLLGQIAAKLMPVIIQDLIELAGFVFTAVKAELANPQFQASFLVVLDAATNALSVFWSKLNIKEQLTLVFTPFVLITLVLLLLRLHG